jgi:hypothetical protein
MSALRPYQRLAVLVAVLYCAAGLGCAALPDRIVEPQFHNPLPQIHRVAVLPFFNQSAEPTVNGEAVAIAYYNELQLVPGFEVMPVGVAKQMLAASIQATGQEPIVGSDFQKLARQMNVDAVIVGSITEYSPYYPPRMGLAVNWYAANPRFIRFRRLWTAVGPAEDNYSQHARAGGRVRPGPRAAQNADARAAARKSSGWRVCRRHGFQRQSAGCCARPQPPAPIQPPAAAADVSAVAAPAKRAIARSSQHRYCRRTGPIPRGFILRRQS